MKQQKDKGFTIIEVVLVLAIAGLIFLMVFIALPALQRSQRDTQRRNDLSRAQTAVNNYQTNNRNKLPTFDNNFIQKYLITGANDSFNDPNGTPYAFVEGDAENKYSGENANIYYTIGSVCSGEEDNPLRGKQGAGKVALQYKLEGGGLACVSN